MKFIESYKQHLSELRLFSKTSSFLIATVTFLSFFHNLYFLLFYSDGSYINENLTEIFISIVFHLLIAITFAARFVFLFFKKHKFIWLSQSIWLVGWLSIYAYKLATAKILLGSFFGSAENFPFDSFYYNTFLAASNSLVVILLAYFFLSPIKQVLILAVSLLFGKRIFQSQ